MNHRRALVVFALCAALVGSGCGSTDAVAATVNGREIDRSEFERELGALRDNEQLQAAGGEGLTGSGRRTVSAELTAGWLTALIYDALITAEFERRKLEVKKADREAAAAQLATQFGNPRVAQAFPDWFRTRVVERNTRAVAVRTAVSGLDTSEAALRKYYEDHKADLEQACLSHILVETKEAADAVVARVKGGEDFAAVAKETSQDPGSGPKGGDLGCNAKSVPFVAEFKAAAFSLPVNTVSDPVQTQFGFHVLLVRERKTIPFEPVRSEVKTALNNESQGAFRTFLDKAARKAKVTMDARYGTFIVEPCEPSAEPCRAPEVVPPEVPSPAEGRPGKGGGDGGQQPPLPVAPEAPAPEETPAPEAPAPAPDPSTPPPSG